MAKILHLATDEKFISAAEYLYERAFPSQNVFFVVLPDKRNYKLRFLKEKENYYFFTENKKALSYITEQLDEYDLVVLHGYDIFKSLVVNKRKDVIYNWLLWGAEIYNWHKVFKSSIYGNETQKILIKESIIKSVFRPVYHLIKYGVFNIHEFKFATISYIDYLSIIHIEDYELFRNKGVVGENTKHLKYTYYPIEFILGDNTDMIVTDNNILLGNSSSHSNNHIEAFKILKKLDLKGRNVITPLSYGIKEYGEIIVKSGKEYLGDRFVPLTEFMSLQEYNNIMQTCGIVVMNHYRQQAIGNILASMWMGAKVFLDERNSFYHYLKRLGCIVYSIVELTDDNLQNLTEEQIKHNRAIIFNEISTESVVNTLKMDISNIIK